MIFFLAWLVQMGYFVEASFFCMQVGHTFSRIDQTFRTLIGHLLSKAIWTVEQLVASIAQYLSAYNCEGCAELHCVWNWKDYFAPHIHQRFTGFATGQFGSGMHEFLLRKDRNGVVRLWFRASSQVHMLRPICSCPHSLSSHTLSLSLCRRHRGCQTARACPCSRALLRAALT